MTKRLTVSIDDAELRTIQLLAHRDNVRTAEWVRRRLREAVTASARPDVASRLAAIDAAYRHTTAEPETDIAVMLEQIEAGYLEKTPAP